MHRAAIFAVTAVSIFAPTAWAAEVRLLPSEILLTGPHASQQLLVVGEEAGQIIGEHNDGAKFTSSNPNVAAVDETGMVQAVSDGEATITASHEGKQATAKVRVTKTKEPFSWSFIAHIIPIMTRAGCNSGACHGALAGKGGLKLSLRGYDPDADYSVLTRQAFGRRIDRTDPAASLLLQKPTAKLKHGGGVKLDADSPDYDIIRDWIIAGAPAPRKEEAAIQRIEVLPATARLKPEDKIQVVVRAAYTDGRMADVTRWAKFSSSEDLVAGVDEHGKITVNGHGEAAISVIFSNLVATSRIVSPLPNPVDAKTFSAAPRHNYIDNLVLKKLESLRIPPSSACTDAEFIRRAYLDAAGILPTPEELQKFLADSSPGKRATLIDSLLSRPEFIDYWTYKWSDLLLVATHKLSPAAMWTFHQYIRDAVEANKPWDVFAREVLTASGSTSQNGAAGYFAIHKDVSALTESTSVTFLGMSITCCRCHNHPLEKWTQDQYWGMANLFSRVAVKNGDRAGELTVQALPMGDVLHMRRGVPMPPAPLDGKPLAMDSPTDRRRYFADWLTSPENPYFAKALVNRVWRNFMGRGLVEAEDDLRQTNPPTNEELFEALAKDFITHKYDVKHIIRTIMNSAAYQRSAKPLPENASDDRFYSHYLIRRLPAEVILDAYAQVSGVPTEFAGYPKGTRALQLPDVKVASKFLDSFGRPERLKTCSCEREQDSSVGQALHLNNGQTLNDKLKEANSHVGRFLQQKLRDEEAVKRVFLSALGREPTPSEMQKFKDALAVDPKSTEAAKAKREALEDVFWAVLTGREFLFNR